MSNDREKTIQRLQAKYTRIFKQYPNIDRSVIVNGEHYDSLSVASHLTGIRLQTLQLAMLGQQANYRRNGLRIPLNVAYANSSPLPEKEHPCHP